MIDDLEALKLALRQFAEDRDWRRFHTQPQLAAAVAVEAGELLECFLWGEDWRGDRVGYDYDAVRSEAADVLIFLVRLADVCGFDLLTAAERKMRENEVRFPAQRRLEI